MLVYINIDKFCLVKSPIIDFMFWSVYLSSIITLIYKLVSKKSQQFSPENSKEIVDYSEKNYSKAIQGLLISICLIIISYISIFHSNKTVLLLLFIIIAIFLYFANKMMIRSSIVVFSLIIFYINSIYTFGFYTYGYPISIFQPVVVRLLFIVVCGVFLLSLLYLFYKTIHDPIAIFILLVSAIVVYHHSTWIFLPFVRSDLPPFIFNTLSVIFGDYYFYMLIVSICIFLIFIFNKLKFISLKREEGILIFLFLWFFFIVPAFIFNRFFDGYNIHYYPTIFFWTTSYIILILFSAIRYKGNSKSPMREIIYLSISIVLTLIAVQFSLSGIQS